MLRRFLTLLGFGWYLPQASDFSNTLSTRPDTDGQVTISPVLGHKVALTTDEAAEVLDKTRERITDSDLVWPGKVETIALRNDEAVDYRFNLSIVNIEPSFYMRRPAQGGRWQPDGSVLLTPGEETAFEVVFQPPPADRRTTLRDFRFVITRFDPRRATDPGEVFGEILMRWVPIPGKNDLKIVAKETSVITRPWRRTALFQLNFLNKSLLPPSVALKIVRAQTKEKLGAEAEQVGALQQSLESRTPCAWHCLLPAGSGSYYATVVGEALVGDEKASQKFPLSLSQPVQVRYVPWLRMGKDWVFLGVLLFALLYGLIGIPVLRTPVATLKILNPPPSGASWSDVDLKITPEGATVKNDGNGDFTITLPSRWGGNRFPFGWSWLNHDPGSFTARIIPPEKNKENYSKLKLDLLTEGGKSREFKLEPRDDWRYKRNAEVDRELAYLLTLKLGERGALKEKDKIEVTIEVDGQKEPEKVTYTVISDSTLETNYELPTPLDGKARTVTVTAQSKDGKVFTTEAWVDKVKPARYPVEVVLNFGTKSLHPSPVIASPGPKREEKPAPKPDRVPAPSVAPVVRPTPKREEKPVQRQPRVAIVPLIPRQRKFNDIDKAIMIFVPAGEFTMGTYDFTDTKPHRVLLDGYYIYRTPVTVAQYEEFTKSDLAKQKGLTMPPAPDFNPHWSKKDHPIVNVSYNDALAYCEWAGVELPTEAQWEKAAQGGLEGQKYPWPGDWDWNKCANSVSPKKLSGTESVRSYPSNGYELYDMAGNVWQWCRDWYDKDFYRRPLATIRNAWNKDTGEHKYRVLRGGSWYSYFPNNFRSAFHYYAQPDGRGKNVGFRCVSGP